MKKDNTLRIAAVGDIHVRETSEGAYQHVFEEISKEADILLLCGDLTDLGLTEEAEILVHELHHCSIPVIGVLGNHDYHNEKQYDVAKILQDYKVIFVHGTEYIYEKGGIKYGFTGAKGFGGGFKPSMWGRFGEPEQKAFYDAVAKEVEVLENGLDRINHPDIGKRFVLLHFSPIRNTLDGELQELYPFLGSTRLEEVINRYDVTAVFHGHSHYGTAEGKTTNNVPVYNVALPVMKKMNEQKPYRLVEF